MSEEIGLVVLLVTPHPLEAAQLAAALRAAGLDPNVDRGDQQTLVKLPADQIARGAAILAATPKAELPERDLTAPRWVWPSVALGIATIVACAIRGRNPPLVFLSFPIFFVPLFARKLGSSSANRFGTLGLIVALLGNGVARAITNESTTRTQVLAAALPCAVSFVLALVGLFRTGLFRPGAPRTFKVGQAHAWWAFGLSAASGSVLAFLATMLEPSPPPGTPIAFEELNFVIPMPGGSWERSNARELNKDATLAFESGHFQFMVIAEQGDGSLSVDGLIEHWRSGTQERATPPRAVSIDGLDARESSRTSKVLGRDFIYYDWAIEHNGHLYQLIGWGPASRPSTRDELWKVASTFRLIDESRQSPKLVANGSPVGRYVSPVYGYTADLGPRWVTSSQAATLFPSAELVAFCGYRTSLSVTGWPLAGEAIANDLVVRVFAGHYGIDAETPEVGRSDVRLGNFSGTDLVANHDGARYRMRAVSDGKTALLVTQAWPQGSTSSGCEDVIDTVSFRSSLPPTPDQIPRREQVAWFFTAAALDLEQRGKPKEAMKLAARALMLDATNLGAGGVLVRSAGRSRSQKEAHRVLNQLMSRLPDDAGLRGVRAALLEQEGRSREALVEYAKVFDAGFEDDDFFTSYIHLLEKEGQRPRALSQLRHYRTHRDNATLAILDASVTQRSGDLAAAVEILERRLASDDSEELGFELIGLYQTTERHREAIEVATKLMRRGHGGTMLAIQKARSEMALHWYGSAKSTLEAAQRRAPDDENVLQMIGWASNLVGEGANSSIKVPIAPVKLPDELMNPAANSQNGIRSEVLSTKGRSTISTEGSRAFILSRATAISFVNGSDYRTTEYYAVRILGQAGADAFSTLRFDLDPTSERIFVNSLKVFDDAGNLVSTGSVSDAYVSDRASQDAGTSLRSLYVPVPGLEPGRQFEATVTREAATPPPGIWFTRRFLVEDSPSAQNLLFLRGDLDSVRHVGLGGIDARRVGDGLAWIISDQPGFEPEPFDPSPEKIAPAVLLSKRSATWESELDTYLRELGTLLDTDPKLASLARTTAPSTLDRNAAVKSLATYLQRTLTYKNTEFGRGARIPRAPSVVLGHRYGDCKDHALLLAHLLQSVGIDARLALIRSSGDIVHEAPSLDQFDHMVTFVPGATPSIVDATDKWASMAENPFWLVGQEALLVQAGPAKFVRVERGEPSAVEIERAIVVEDESTLGVNEVISARGWVANELRERLGSIESSRQPVVLSGFLGGAKIRSHKIDGLSNPDELLRIHVSWSGPGQIHSSENDLLIKTPARWEERWLRVPSIEPKKHPFELRWSLAIKTVVTIRSPDGRELRPLASGTSSADFAPFGAWKVEIGQSARTATMRFEMERVPGEHQAAKYSIFEAQSAAALSSIQQPLVLRRMRGP